MTGRQSFGNLLFAGIDERPEFLQVGPRDELAVGPFAAAQQQAAQVGSARQLRYEFGEFFQNRLRKRVNLLFGNVERDEADLAGKFLKLKCVAHDDSVERVRQTCREANQQNDLEAI